MIAISHPVRISEIFPAVVLAARGTKGRHQMAREPIMPTPGSSKGRPQGVPRLMPVGQQPRHPKTRQGQDHFLPIRVAVALLALLALEGWQSGLMHRS
jgi:hypothetical protein